LERSLQKYLDSNLGDVKRKNPTNLARVPRSSSCGLLPWVSKLSLRFRPKNMAQPIFQSESELQNIPEAAAAATSGGAFSRGRQHRLSFAPDSPCGQRQIIDVVGRFARPFTFCQAYKLFALGGLDAAGLTV
jgi:hypothetical protein